MLAAAARLRRRDDFTATVRGGRRSRRGALVVHLRTPGDDETAPARAGSAPLPARAGFVVSRAVGGAVVRNLVKRRLRNLVRDRLDRLPAGATIVVRALPEAADRPYASLGGDLDAALAAALGPVDRPGRRPR